MEIIYCQRCGMKLIPKEIGDEGFIPFCEYCQIPYFNNPICSVLVVVVNPKDEVLLLRQNYVSESHWVLVAGYLKVGETLEQAVAREVQEETGLTVQDCHYILSYDYPRKELLMLGFVAYTNDITFTHHSKEVDDLRWASFPIAQQLLREGSIGQQLLKQVFKDVSI